MTKFTKYFLILALFVGLAGFAYYFYTNNQSLKRELDILNNLPDTVYVDKPYKVKPEYKLPEVPRLVTIWFTDTVEVEKVTLKHDTLVLTIKDSPDLEFNTKFLTSYPENPKLIQSLISKDRLSLVLLNTTGITSQEDYVLNLDKYSYNYTSNGLSKKKISVFRRIQPSLGLQYRPINNMVDLDFGLQYNTTRFTYGLGPVLSYYPKFKNDPFLDFYLRIQYNF